MAELTPSTVRRALSGDARALRTMITVLTPVIQIRVARALYRWRSASGPREVRQEVEDLTQDVFVYLLAKSGHVLRTWNAERGLPMSAFVGLIAERHTTAVLKSGRRNPWIECPTEGEKLEYLVRDEGTIDGRVASKELLVELADRLRQQTSPLGFQLFRHLFVDEQSPASVAAEMGMSTDAIYAWRSRLRRLARQLGEELMSDSDPPSSNN